MRKWLRRCAIAYIVFQALFTALLALAQLDVILAVIFLPNPQDHDGIVLVAPIFGWVLAQVLLSPLTALAGIMLSPVACDASRR